MNLAALEVVYSDRLASCYGIGDGHAVGATMPCWRSVVFGREDATAVLIAGE